MSDPGGRDDATVREALRDLVAETLCRGVNGLSCINYDYEVAGGCTDCEDHALAVLAALDLPARDAQVRAKALAPFEALADEPQEDLRMDAYYYGFAPTGVTAIDRILSAVAHAGKAYHHTESWNDDWIRGQYLPHGGDTAADAIQNAANAAAGRLRAALASAGPVEPSPAAEEARRLPIHRTEANYGICCSTCDDGGCPDCTDPA